MTARRPTDPFTVEVIKRALISAAEQMFVALGRTARSSVIYEVLDYGCALTDASGRMIAQANGIPAFIGVLGDAVRDVLDKFGTAGLEDGDILITNDPYMGGATHQNDAVLVMPIFHDGQLVLFAAGKAHWNDVGGKDPGSWSPNATDIYQEGIQFPVVKIFNRGEEAVDVSSWTLSTTSGNCVTLTIPEGTVLEPDESYLVTRECRWLDNSDESIVLTTDSNLEVGRTLPLSDDDNDGQVWFLTDGDTPKWRYGWP